MRDVFDNLVGFVRLSDLESELYEHPFVSRLANIKQLGLAHLTFPGATHSRLAHSVGTLHYAESIGRKLVERFPRQVKDKHFLEKVRAAALLHDIGHPPLSHGIELWLKKIYNDASVAYNFGDKTQKAFVEHSAVKRIQTQFSQAGNPFDNSVLSAFLVRNSTIAGILKKYGVNPEEIAMIVAGLHQREFYSQVLDGGLDADKLDYLQRDRQGTGVVYGTFDVHQILENIGLTNDTIYFDEDAANACQHFMLVRYFWYSQIIKNKNVAIFEEMGRLLYQALSENSLLPTPKELLDWLERIAGGNPKAEQNWSAYDDIRYFSAIEEARQRLSSTSSWNSVSLDKKTFLDFADRIRSRRPLRRVARVDSVETYHPKSRGVPAWQNHHPRADAFADFERWLHQKHQLEMDKNQVVVLKDDEKSSVILVKAKEAERPIYAKTKYDPSPIPLQEHYYSVLLPMALEHDRFPVRFRTQRVYAVDSLFDKLNKEWLRLAKL